MASRKVVHYVKNYGQTSFPAELAVNGEASEGLMGGRCRDGDGFDLKDLGHEATQLCELLKWS